MRSGQNPVNSLRRARYFQGQLCAFGQPIQLTEYAGAGHVHVLAASQADVVDYVTARFERDPAPTNC